MNHPSNPSPGLLAEPSREFLEQLASSAPVPGGGAAAALAGALAAALVEMVANLTVGKKRYADVESEAQAARAQAATLRDQLQRGVDEDARAYASVSAAYGLPRDSDDQKATRSRAIQDSLRVAASAPLEAAAVCADVLRLCEDTAATLNPNVISDVMVAALMAQAALEAALINVEVNRLALTDAAERDRLTAEMHRIRDGQRERLDRTLAIAGARLPGAGTAS